LVLALIEDCHATSAIDERVQGLKESMRTSERPDRRHRTRARLPGLIAALALAAWLAPASALATSPLGWSAASAFDSGGTPSAVSCASETLCVAVDGKGRAFSTNDPSSSRPSWDEADIDPGGSLSAVSCAPAGRCVAVDAGGHALVSAGTSTLSWSASVSIDEGLALTGVSCPAASLCVAVDASGNVLSSAGPGAGVWTKASIDPGHSLTAVSCSSATLCVAVDDAGDVLASADPSGGAGTWPMEKVDSAELLSVSCSAAGACVAGDALGNALGSADPTALAATWSLTPIDGGEALTAASCASSGLCVMVGGDGQARASDAPATPIPGWSASSADPGALTGIACLPGGWCVAIDAAGRSVTGKVPAPTVTTVEATQVTATSATAAGVVNPNDALLGSCSFEYGIGGAGGHYEQSVACASLPAPLDVAQAVSAQLPALIPNTTYHYRVVALSPAGAGAGADVTFTTPSSSQIALVHPSPSITGTPASGQTLTCHAGLSAGASAQLSYAWLRDLIPIAGAINSTYMVKGQDTGHHLQCQVTATDGGGSASAKSAFVTIPVGGVPASVGETGVGSAVSRGWKISVPIVCSTLASRGCEVALRVTAVETFSGARVVAIAARSRRGARQSAAVLHKRTVTLARIRVHLSPGAHGAVTATLTTTGRRLLASARRFSAYVHVSGTVIGVIEAQLAQLLVTLVAPSRSQSTHAARHR
jgi:hypothetical protein